MTQSRLYYRIRRDGSADVIECVPGQIIDVDCDPADVKFIYVSLVPDPDHQSSLDYLKGV